MLLPLIAACSDMRMLGATAVEQRRELNELERRYAGLVCGDAGIMQAPLPLRGNSLSSLPEQLVAAERAGS